MRPAVRPVLAKAEDDPVQGWGDARGQASWTRLFSQGSTPTDSMTAGVAVLRQGGFLAPHRHPPAEIYYILEGRGTITIDGAVHDVDAGTGIFIPGGCEHSIRNDAVEPLRFFYVFAVDRAEDIGYDFS